MNERPRRRAVQLSEIDQRRLERGETPTWLDPTGEPELSGGPEETDPQLSNDQRLLGDVPPHWSPKGD